MVGNYSCIRDGIIIVILSTILNNDDSNDILLFPKIDSVDYSFINSWWQLFDVDGKR